MSASEGEQFQWPLAWMDDSDVQPEVRISEDFSASVQPKMSKKKQTRQQKDQRRKAHQKSNLKERKALLGMLKSLPDLVPSLSPSLENALASAELSRAGEMTREELAAFDPDAALNSFDFDAALDVVEATFCTGVRYRSLPNVFGPSEAISALSNIIDRNKKFDEKNLPQEMSLVTKLWALAKGAGHFDSGSAKRRLAVVDIGAGNGCLALLAAIVLDAYAVLIDHTLPHEELRVECKVPEPYRSRILRINGDVGDLDLCRDLEPLLEKHGIERAIVVAKHLCGVGTDLALDLIRRWRLVETKDSSADTKAGTTKVELLGVVFATCCGHKIGSDIETYVKLNNSDHFLQELVKDDARLHQLLSVCTPCVSWRTTADALGSRIMTTQVRAAELFEDTLQAPRISKLRSMFPAATEVAFVPAERSLQNRCILAGTVEGVRLALDLSAEDEALTAVRLACDRTLEITAGTPLDLRPKGVFSSKYGEDEDT